MAFEKITHTMLKILPGGFRKRNKKKYRSPWWISCRIIYLTLKKVALELLWLVVCNQNFVTFSPSHFLLPSPPRQLLLCWKIARCIIHDKFAIHAALTRSFYLIVEFFCNIPPPPVLGSISPRLRTCAENREKRSRYPSSSSRSFRLRPPNRLDSRKWNWIYG